jgi:C4-dicarboxylate transporter
MKVKTQILISKLFVLLPVIPVIVVWMGLGIAYEDQPNYVSLGWVSVIVVSIIYVLIVLSAFKKLTKTLKKEKLEKW